jgi:hypothetical protein
MKLQQHPLGNYHFLTGIAPYSAGVVADEGYTLARFQLIKPLPYRVGFDRIAALLEGLDRPKQALCAIELRIPEPLSFQGFIDFNAGYCEILRAWDIYVGDSNPVARTNVAPAVAPPAEPSLFAFTITLPMEAITALARHAPSTLELPPSSFVVAGAGDLRDQADLRAEAIVRPNETSPEAMVEKAAAVLQVMHDRLVGLGGVWDDVAAANVYTVHPLHALLESTLLPRLGAAAIHGVNWYYSRPPIAGLEFEMDLRNVALDLRIS